MGGASGRGASGALLRPHQRVSPDPGRSLANEHLRQELGHCRGMSGAGGPRPGALCLERTKKRSDPMSGLLALLDDVAAIAKVAAASVDDIGAQAVKAGSKAAGAVIDDAAVTPK